MVSVKSSGENVPGEQFFPITGRFCERTAFKSKCQNKRIWTRRKEEVNFSQTGSQGGRYDQTQYGKKAKYLEDWKASGKRRMETSGLIYTEDPLANLTL
jgi:hypothetical protein